MKAIFDTSSFECIMKHYVPIDRSGELKVIIEENFSAGEFILIDKVYKEICNYEAGFVLKEFPFLKDKRLIVNTSTIIPNTIFYSHLNDFVDQSIVHNLKRPLTPAQVELGIQNYLNGADGRLLIFAHSIISENPIIVTEETVKANDGKLIRKIPYNCSFLNINCCNFPQLLKENFSVSLSMN